MDFYRFPLEKTWLVNPFFAEWGGQFCNEAAVAVNWAPNALILRVTDWPPGRAVTAARAAV